MTVAKGFSIIILSSLAFALGGTLIGYILAVTIPGYYRAVYRSGDEPWFDPLQVGVGLGATQGLICGLVVGAAVVLAVAWYNSRRGSLDVKWTPAMQQELQRRLADLTVNPGNDMAWEQIQAEALTKFRK